VSTLADFRFLVSNVIGMDNSSGSMEQTLIDKWCSDAVTYILVRTKARVLVGTFNLTAGSKDYDIDPEMLLLLKIVMPDGTPCREESPERIYERRAANAASYSGSYCYAFDGSNLLMFYPTPSSNDQLTTYFVPRPDRMTSPTDDPSLPQWGGIPAEWHKLIELYALAEASDYDDDQSAAQGVRYRQDFEVVLNQFKKANSRKGGRILPRFSITPPSLRDGAPISHDRSADVY
jgi:hypothetical protein